MKTVGEVTYADIFVEARSRSVSWQNSEVFCQGFAYMGIVENEMETTIMENQMEKKMENEMETGIVDLFAKQDDKILTTTVSLIEIHHLSRRRLAGLVDVL